MSKKDFERAWKLMAELRKETLESHRMRTQVIGFKITFVSTGIGVIVANLDKVPKELVAIPALASIFFDMLIINYSIAIRRIGLYCQDYIEPIFKREAQMDKDFCWWEEFVEFHHVRPRFAIIAHLGFTALAILSASFILLLPYRPLDALLIVLLLGLFAYDMLAFLIPKRIAQKKTDWLTRFFIGSYRRSNPMLEHPNATMMRRAAEAFINGDMATLKQLIAEDAVWHVPGRSQLAGDYSGHDQIFGFFGKLMELTGGTFKIEVHDVLATDDHVVNLDRMTAARGDKRLDQDLILVVHPKDGKIAEAWDRFSDLYAWDDFWA